MQAIAVQLPPPMAMAVDRAQRKHVRLACLECRRRHTKCDGLLPVCGKCLGVKDGESGHRECVYAPSHRGGKRVKRKASDDGASDDSRSSRHEPKHPIVMPPPPLLASTALSASPFTAPRLPPPAATGIPMHHHIPGHQDMSLQQQQQQQQQQQHRQPNRPVTVPQPPANQQSHPQLYSPPSGSQIPTPTMMGSPAIVAKMNVTAANPFTSQGSGGMTPSAVVNGTQSQVPSGTTTSKMFVPISPPNSIDMVPTSQGSQVSPPTHSCGFTSPMTPDSGSFSVYYSAFHEAHPLIPDRDAFETFLATAKSPPELAAAMLLVERIQTDGCERAGIPTAVQEIDQLLRYAPDDLVKLQTLIIMSLVTHLNAVHEFSLRFRHQAVNMSLSLVTQNPDGGHELNVTPLMAGDRMAQVPVEMIVECAKRCLSELHFIDVLFGAASNYMVSAIAQSPIPDLVADIPDRKRFCYRLRNVAVRTVDEVVRFLAHSGQELQESAEFYRLQAHIATWQGCLNDPASFQAPHLIDHFGNVNEGVMQAIISLNYAAILLNLPFSTFVKCDVPSYANCAAADVGQNIEPLKEPNMSRRVMSSRHCLTAANNVVRIVSEVGVSSVVEHTPMLACALVMSLLIRIKGYIWHSSAPQSIPQEELTQYLTYVELECRTLEVLGMKWRLAYLMHHKLTELMRYFASPLYEHVYTIPDPPTISTTVSDDNTFGSSSDTSFEDFGLEFLDKLFDCTVLRQIQQ